MNEKERRKETFDYTLNDKLHKAFNYDCTWNSNSRSAKNLGSLVLWMTK